MLPKSLFCRYSIVFEASQAWQPQDQRPKRHVTVCRAIDNWQLLITAEGFGKLIRICCGSEGRGQLLQPNRVKGKKMFVGCLSYNTSGKECLDVWQ